MPDGRGTGFWQNGQVWCEGHFRDGKPHGHCKVYFPSGALRHEGEYVEGLPKGRGTEYREDGRPWFDGVFAEQSFYYYYGVRRWVEGRLYDDKGRLEYEGKFESSGRGSKPIESA